MAERVPLDRIQTRLQTVINNLGDYQPSLPGQTPDPYIADAAAFATQAKVCVTKQIQVEAGSGGGGKPAPSAAKTAKKGK